MPNAVEMIKKVYSSGPFRVFLKLALATVLLIALITTYRNYVWRIETANYRVFNIQDMLSWKKDKHDIYRTIAYKNTENLLLSDQPWQEFDLSFDLRNPQVVSLVFSYLNPNKFQFLILNRAESLIVWGRRSAIGQNISPITIFPIKDEQKCRLIFKDKKCTLRIEDKVVFESPANLQEGKFGFLLNEVYSPATTFANVIVKGRLFNGTQIEAHVVPKKKVSAVRYAYAFLPFCGLLFLFCWGGVFVLRQVKESCLRSTAHAFPRWVHQGSAWGVHLLLTALLFWPFVLKQKVLVASYDNFGEILPFFFYSKQCFWEIIRQKSLGLWNPLLHNGFPFYRSHWNMIYYPLNWIVFLFEDRLVLKALTGRIFFEVFLLGGLAYQFFYAELRNRRWALFSSICYQLCSIVLFSLSVFSSISLYFSMTFYLYLLWTCLNRKPGWNYFWMTIALFMMLTSANMAFTFYAMMAVVVITIYRLLNLEKINWKNVFCVLFSFLSAGVISIIRLLPCYWGIKESNRLIGHYYTIHDRFFIVLRLFFPGMAGRAGTGYFNPLMSDRLRLIFRELHMPSNPQNVFFVYFGVLAAVFLVFSLLMRLNPRGTFWKVYTFVTLAIGLLWQPIWGILSVLFFPMIHYSYHTLIIPIGFCALIGHAGLALEEGKISLKPLLRRAGWILLLVLSYFIVYMTYLFPDLTKESRILLICLWSIMGVLWLIKKYCKKCYFDSLRWVFIFGAGLIWSLLFVAATLVLVQPFSYRPFLAKYGILPSLFFYCFLATTMFGYLIRHARFSNNKIRVWQIIVGLLILLGLVFGMHSTSFIKNILSLNAEYQDFAIDNLLGLTRFFLIGSVAVFGLCFFKLHKPLRGVIGGVFLVVLSADLLLFNYRYDNLVSPTFHKDGAYYQEQFPYDDLSSMIKKQLDLVNYRVDYQHRANLNGNKNLLFGVPSISGITGYMMQRYANLLINFGYPKDANLVYPGDMKVNDRFLDLSAVRYLFASRSQVYERPTALGRLNLFYNHEVITDEKKVLERLKDENFNVNTTVVLSQDLEEKLLPLNNPARVIKIGQSTKDRVTAEVDTLIPGIVLFNDSFDAGWKAYVDGNPVKIIQANYNFMACFLPAGKHKLSFVYEPEDYFVLRKVSLWGLVVFFVIFGLSFVRLKRIRV